MPAPKDASLPTFVYHRLSVVYAGAAAALSGTAIGYDRLPVTTNAVPVFGVLESDVTPGEVTVLAVAGVCEMIAGGAIAVGAIVTIDATSRAVAGAAGQQIFGRALSAATAAGQKIQVLITREGTN